MARLALVANPAASRFSGGSHRAVVRTLRSRFEVEPLWPSSAADARGLAKRALESGTEIVVAMGGDGIVHQLANALAGSDAALAIVPAGTTNVYARLLGIPTKAVSAARLLVAGAEPVAQPTLRVELWRGSTCQLHHALFAAGLGFDAEIVAVAEAEPYRKAQFGAVHYARTSLGLLWREFGSRRPHLRAVSGDRKADAAGLMVQFRSAYTFFGPVPLRLHPDPPDPATMLLIEELNLRRAFPMVASAAIRRSLGELPGMSLWEGVSEVSVEAEPPVAVQADGEPLGSADRVEIRHVPAGLKVAVPRP